MKTCSPKRWNCDNQTDSPSGLCDDCLKKSSKNFWEFVESFKQIRLEQSKNTK